ncbi:BRAP family protein [Megaselia abdita]
MNIVPKGVLPTSASRETTPLDDNQSGSSEFPKEITVFSGNPFVEVTQGILHLYKKNERKEIRDGPSNQLCLLAVPASMSCHDLLKFVAPCHSVIQHIRIIKDGSPNQFLVLLEFRSNESALEFYQTYNGAAYNSLEPDSVCHAVWVSSVEWSEDGFPPLGHIELPICPVCLERMDESVDGVLTILCNHAFHTNCLIKWGDSTCPVCRYVQTPEQLENSVCMECEGTEALWICLICGHVGCGRYQGGHAAAHFRATNHSFALQLGTSSVWDYAGDNFVHRLFQNKTDGKLVAGETNSDEQDREEKIESMQMEFTYLLTSQLDTQRQYYEDRLDESQAELEKLRSENVALLEQISKLNESIGHFSKEKCNLEKKVGNNNAKIKELQKQLAEEKQISKAFDFNQTSWRNRYHEMVKNIKDLEESKNAELAEVREQLRDVMFYMEAQRQISESDLKEEMQEGNVIVPEPSTSAGTGIKNRKKKKNRD